MSTTAHAITTAVRVCASCGAEMPADAAFCPACGTRVETEAVAGPAAVAPDAALIATGPVPASLLARGVAFFIDYLLLGFAISVAVNVADATVGGAAVGVAGLAVVAAGQWYWAGLESSRWQASIGKQAMRLIVVNIDGTRLTLNRALVRSGLSIVPLFFAYTLIFAGAATMGGLLILFVVPAAVLIAPFTERRQALHDLLTGTMVTRRPDA